MQIKTINANIYLYKYCKLKINITDIYTYVSSASFLMDFFIFYRHYLVLILYEFLRHNSRTNSYIISTK